MAVDVADASYNYVSLPAAGPRFQVVAIRWGVAQGECAGRRLLRALAVTRPLRPPQR
jgi:hypothetical protein